MNRLIIFTRYPERGAAKTRLIPVLGEEGAADLSRRMTEHTIRMAGEVPVSLELRFDGADVEKMKAWLGNEWSYVSQGNGDLGERMKRAFQEAFQDGVEKAVVIGTDCPGLTAKLIQTAFAALDSNDMVLGPAADGGYYLIGLSKNVPELFDGIPWGTENVFEYTRTIARNLKLSVAFLETLTDIDRPEDLSEWKGTIGEKFISVIIPALNEEKNLPKTLSSIQNSPHVEIIVVDGGSEDKTVEVAKSFGARVLLSEPGRAKQMNKGATQARGDVFLFLHADTCLPENFVEHVQRAMSEPHVVAAAFQLRFDAPHLWLQLYERFANWRSRVTQTVFGDQAIAVKKNVFQALDGYADIPIMEDYELIHRLRRTGRIAVVPACITTSSRRWLTNGLLRTAILNRLAILAYHLGIPPAAIARWYCQKPLPYDKQPEATGVQKTSIEF